MSSGTNQERITQNNTKLAELKTKADNLPEYQDIEPVYATLDISLNYKMSKANISSFLNNCFVGNEWAIFTSSSYSSTNNPTIYIYYKGELVKSFSVSEFITLPRSATWILVTLSLTDNEIAFCLYRNATNDGIYAFKYNKTTNLVTYIGILTLTDSHYWGNSIALSTTTPLINATNNYGVASIRFFEESNLFCVNGKYSSSGDMASYLHIYKYDITENTLQFVADMGGYGYPISSWFVINCTKFQYTQGHNFARLSYNDGYIKLSRDIYPNDLDINGVNYLGNKVFKGGNVYELNADLSIGSLIGENIYESSEYGIEAVNDKFYRYKNKLYMFDEETNIFTELGENFYWSGSTIYKLVDNYIEVYKFEKGQKQIGSIYNNIFIPIMNGSFIESNEIINGKLAYNELHQQLIGTMPNNGQLNYTPSTSQQTIPAGYTSGGTIGAVTSSIDSNIIADNIKSGVTILGVTGTYTEQMKEYASETDMNDNIANIQEGEVVKVTSTIFSDGNSYLVPKYPTPEANEKVIVVYDYLNGKMSVATYDSQYTVKQFTTEDRLAIGVFDNNEEQVSNAFNSKRYTNYPQDMTTYVTSKINTFLGPSSGGMPVFYTNESIYDTSDNLVYEPTNIQTTYFIKETTMKKLAKEETINS